MALDTCVMLIVLWLVRPRAENHMKKKRPVWGRYASSDQAEKTRTALLEKRTI